MSHKNRTAAKVDANQAGIVRDLKNMGVSVEPGHDDLLCGHDRKTFWFEVKSEDAISKKTGQVKESSKRKSQKKLDREWTGQRDYISTTEEAVKIIFKK